MYLCNITGWVCGCSLQVSTMDLLKVWNLNLKVWHSAHKHGDPRCSLPCRKQTIVGASEDVGVPNVLMCGIKVRLAQNPQLKQAFTLKTLCSNPNNNLIMCYDPWIYNLFFNNEMKRPKIRGMCFILDVLPPTAFNPVLNYSFKAIVCSQRDS